MREEHLTIDRRAAEIMGWTEIQQKFLYIEKLSGFPPPDDGRTHYDGYLIPTPTVNGHHDALVLQWVQGHWSLTKHELFAEFDAQLQGIWSTRIFGYLDYRIGDYAKALVGAVDDNSSTHNEVLEAPVPSNTCGH